MTLRMYGLTVGSETALTLLCALPFVLFALWRSPARPWKLLVLVGVLVLVQNALGDLPRVHPLQPLHWNWQAALLTAVWPLALMRWIPGLSLATMGLTSKLRAGWLLPSLVALVIAGGVPTVFFFLGSRVHLTAEGWVYLSIMPGLGEEILFRGLFQPLLNDALGKPWRLGGAEFGWGLVVTAILFAGSNGLVRVDAQHHAHVALFAGIAPFLLGLVSGWVRERTGSVWPCVVGHNVSNLAIPLATLLSRS